MTNASPYHSFDLVKHNKMMLLTLGLSSALISLSSPASAQTPAEISAQGKTTSHKTLVVGTKHAPPFSMKDSKGEWTGISIDLWRDIAGELELQFQFQEFDLKWMLEGVKKKKLDAAIAAITMTPQREAVLDFSYPYYYSGLGVAVSSSYQENTFREFFSRLLSIQALQYLLAIILCVFSLCLLVLILNVSLESKGQFRTKKSPTHIRTLDHRILNFKSAFLWLLSDRTGQVVLFISVSLTATIVTFYQPQMLEMSTLIQKPGDLRKVRVGTVSHSSSVNYLKKLGIEGPELYESIDRGLNAVSRREITAFIYDKPILNYYVNQDEDSEVSVLELQFEPQGYGIALPPGSKLREKINRIMLQRLSKETYIKRLSKKYLGVLD